MSVVHGVGFGFGYKLDMDEIEAWFTREFPTLNFYYPDEAMDLLLRAYPHLGYMVGGSYFGNDPIEVAVVTKSSARSASDLEGILELDGSSYSTVAHGELCDSWRKAHPFDPPQIPVGTFKQLISGLWS